MWPLSLMHHTLITCWNDSVLDILGFWKSYLPFPVKNVSILLPKMLKKKWIQIVSGMEGSVLDHLGVLENGVQTIPAELLGWYTQQRESWPYWALWWDWHKKECLFIWYCFTKDKCQNTLLLLVKVVVFHEYTNIVCIWELEKYEADIITLIPVSILILRLLLWLI